MSYMRQTIYFFILALLIFPFTAQALNADLKQKYPYSVLTNDYGLLNEIDLDSELDGIKHPPLFSERAKGYIYWQCFPRDSVTVSLEDLGYSPEDDPESDVKYNGENNARLTITAKSKGGIFHQYVMWSSFPHSLTQDRYNSYLKLMHEEKHVCIAGSYLEKEATIIKGEIEETRQKIYYWGFEKLKTTKGCEAYHRNGCHYEQPKNPRPFGFQFASSIMKGILATIEGRYVEKNRDMYAFTD